MLMVTIVVILIILIVISGIIWYYLGRKSVNHKLALLGGELRPITEGRNSYCLHDTTNNVLIKYYVEYRNNLIERSKIRLVVRGRVIDTHRYHELDVLIKLRNELGDVYVPMVDQVRSRDVDRTSNPNRYDEIFGLIDRGRKLYSNDDSILKMITMEFIEGISLKSYLVKHGLTFDGKSIEKNDVRTDVMIVVFKKLFELIMHYVRMNVLPHDLDNITNVMVTSDSEMTTSIECRVIDCAAYATIDDRNGLTDDDLFISYLYYALPIGIRSLNMFSVLHSHVDKVEITRKSLSELVSDETIEYIITHFVNINTTLTMKRINLINSLIGDNNMQVSSLRHIIGMIMLNHNKLNNLKSSVSQTCFDIDVNSLKYDDRSNMRIAFEKMYKANLNVEQWELIMMLIRKITPEEVINDVKRIVENDQSTNPTLTLYYAPNSVIGYTDQRNVKTNDVQSITTNRYIKLSPEYAECSPSRTYVGTSQWNSLYHFDARFCASADVHSTEYLIVTTIDQH